jgi:tRNA A-37 threonylcarbamoyl transferase component Bud32
VTIEVSNGKKFVVKRNKPSKEFHEFLLIYTYSLISILLAIPSAPPRVGEIMRNEGHDMRKNLGRIGISTPALISISDYDLVEEYIEGGDLYRALAFGQAVSLAFEAGCLTGRLHKAGYAFVDNKAQNYLVSGNSVIRTDLGFIQKSSSQYAKCMDIGSFLASVMDLRRYGLIEKAFYEGYLSESASSFHYLSLLVRNLLCVGFSSDSKVTVKNMLLNSVSLLDI